MSHSFLEDEKILELNHTETCFFVYCLCRAGKANSGIIAVPLTHCKQIGKFTEEQIKKCAEKVIALGMVSALSEEEWRRYVDGTSTVAIQTDKQTDIFSSTRFKKPIDVLNEFEAVKSLMLEKEITLESQKAILEAYPDKEWVISELKAMIAWETANPEKKKKRFTRFAINWLKRGWDKRKFQSGSNKSHSTGKVRMLNQGAKP